MKKNTMILFTLILVLSFLLTSCDDSEEDGLCLLDPNGKTQCYDCWDQSTCDGVGGTKWISGQSSCNANGYNDYLGNNCGYYWGN